MEDYTFLKSNSKAARFSADSHVIIFTFKMTFFWGQRWIHSFIYVHYSVVILFPAAILTDAPLWRQE